MTPSSGDPSGDLTRALFREVERSVRRTRNGIKHATGISHADVGLTPKTTVWSRHKAQLWRYESDHVSRGPPVLLIFSLLTRSYVLDLRPGSSLVERLLEDGFDVYLLDWGIPDASDAANTLETYVDDYLPRALRAVYRTSGSDDVTLFGYCLGGTLAAMLISAHDELPVANLVAVASPIDFQIASRVTPLFDPDLVHADDVLDDSGNVPPEFLWTAFTLLKPTRLAVTYANLWQNLWNDEWLAGYQAMAQWTRDHIPLPGAALRQLQDLTRRNALVTNEFALGGRPVRLSSITCPILNVIAEHDHVVPVDAATPLTRLVSSREATDLRLPVGHMSLLTGRGAMRSTMPPVVEWMRAHSCLHAGRRW